MKKTNLKKNAASAAWPLLCAALAASGCTSARYARELAGDSIRVSARYELETTHEDARVSGNGESTTWLHFIPDSQETSDGYFSDVGSLFSGLSPTQSLALRAAVADACKNSGADFLLLPRYDMTTTSCWFFYESATCRVSGYPAKIQKIRQVRAGDVFRSEERAENSGDDAPESSR